MAERTDIVRHLRRCDVESCGTDGGKRCITRRECEERNTAADEIERQEREIRRLEVKVRVLSGHIQDHADMTTDPHLTRESPERYGLNPEPPETP